MSTKAFSLKDEVIDMIHLFCNRYNLFKFKPCPKVGDCQRNLNLKLSPDDETRRNTITIYLTLQIAIYRSIPTDLSEPSTPTSCYPGHASNMLVNLVRWPVLAAQISSRPNRCLASCIDPPGPGLSYLPVLVMLVMTACRCCSIPVSGVASLTTSQ